MGLSRIGKMFVDLDIYGHAIGVNYRGQDAYKTRLGALFTLATRILMTMNLVILLIAFFEGTKQEEKMQSIKFDSFYADSVDLVEQKFLLSFLTVPHIDEKLGRFVGRMIAPYGPPEH